ncbi:MAG: hypothetical protein WCK58_17745 [Chloroflexota bacterium]
MPDPVPVVDGLLAATALVHDLVLVPRNVLVTRDVRDIAWAGARYPDSATRASRRLDRTNEKTPNTGAFVNRRSWLAR